MFYYFDWTYLILVMPAFIFAMWAQSKVKSTYARYSRIPSRRNITGAQAAKALMEANGINDVDIETTDVSLGDYFDPQHKVVKLSVYNNTSVAGIGIACHEIGHAIQHQQGYFPVKIRTAIVPITNFGAKICLPLILIGFLMSSVSLRYYNLVYVGLACFALSTVFQLVTLPVEFDASKRALKGIQELGLLDSDELYGTKKVLSAAALTYVAALAVSLAQLLRMILIFGRGNRQ